MRSVAALFVFAISLSLFGQDKSDNEMAKLNWHPGPYTGKLGTLAEIKVPEKFSFLDAKDTRRFLELTENIPEGDELGLIASEENWFILFSFSDIGYVKDDEKGKIDANAILESLKEGNEEANQERKKRGWTPLTIVGWFTPPRYDEQSHNLEWATQAVSNGHTSVNYQTRLLGRQGVMNALLVANPKEMATAQPSYKGMLSDFQYLPDQKYSAFRSGDKVAQYGLTALILGGAAGAAAKTGLLKSIGKILLASWKLVIAGIVALGAAVKKMFARPSTEPPNDQEINT